MDNWSYKVYHELYVDTAIDQFNIAQDAYVELMNQENEEPNARTHELVDIIKRNAIATICFSVMALESYVNTVSSVCISKSFAETIDHLDVVAKWIVVARVGANLELNKGQAPLQRIVESVKLRNQFVHSKSKTIKPNENGQVEIPNVNLKEDFVKPAYEALMAIRDVVAWFNGNWKECVLSMYDEDVERKVKDQFKNVDNTWCFMETVTIY